MQNVGYNNLPNITNQTNKNPYKDHSSLVYSKQGYNNLLNTSHFSLGTVVTFATIQTMDNILLKKGKELPKMLKSTWGKIGLSILGGIASILCAKLINPHTFKINEKACQYHSETIEKMNAYRQM